MNLSSITILEHQFNFVAIFTSSPQSFLQQNMNFQKVNGKT